MRVLNKKFICFFIMTLSLSAVLEVDCQIASDYEYLKELQDSMYSPANYSTTLRPVKDQTQPIKISVKFSLVAIVSLDNVKQEMVTNGFLFLFWDDERNGWDPDDYGGVNRLMPSPKEIWRPHLLLINTLGKRDPFEDDYSHTFTGHDGQMGWVPGGIFNTYCALNMEKFPFDVQNCMIQMCPMSHTNTTLQFLIDDTVNLAFYFPNPGWELQKTTVTAENIAVVPSETFSCPTFSFQLKRRPTTIVLNVIIPVILLSVLNNLVFLIPVDSGEKISYGITVLLALTVFLSMVSTMTPQVSDVVPALTIYLFLLLVSSVITVAAAIFSVYLHNLEEKEETSIKSKFNFQKSVKKAITVKTAVAPLDTKNDQLTGDMRDGSDSLHNRVIAPGHNRYRLISKHINKVFFLIMNLVTLILTIWYLVFTNT